MEVVYVVCQSILLVCKTHPTVSRIVRAGIEEGLLALTTLVYVHMRPCYVLLRFFHSEDS